MDDYLNLDDFIKWLSKFKQEQLQNYATEKVKVVVDGRAIKALSLVLHSDRFPEVRLMLCKED